MVIPNSTKQNAGTSDPQAEQTVAAEDAAAPVDAEAVAQQLAADKKALAAESAELEEQ